MESEENNFHRLPTELIISVFNKVSDPKWLCICCLVSKHFAALVLQTRSVSLQIPSTIIPSDGVPVWPPGIIDFLKKLHCLESVTVRFLFGKAIWVRIGETKSLIRWKCDSSNLILVFASSSDNDNRRMLKDFFGAVTSHLHDNKLGFRYIKELLVVLPNVKYASVVDSMNRGRIVLEEEDIASVIKKETKGTTLHAFYAKWWRRSQVKLPYSNCVMKDVILLWMRKTEACDGFVEIKNLFEEKELCELAMMLMKEEATNSESTLPFRLEADFESSLLSTFLIFMHKLRVCQGS